MSTTETRPGLAELPIVAEFKSLWDKGQRPQARALLDQHPELADDKEVVIELAYEEFFQRTKDGESLDPYAFATGFSMCKASLCRQLVCDSFFVEHPELVGGKPGEHLPGFTLVRELGHGAFAQVFLAREIALGQRLVVLKVSRHGGTEAEILGRLRHDNIVPVYSIQKDPLSGRTVVCMPFLGRTTLCDVLDHAFAGGRPPRKARAILEAVAPRPEDAEALDRFKPSKTLLHGTYIDGVLELGAQMADALAFVHERKIYHRDLKPSNVLVRPDGRPMLLDFNLSFDQEGKNQPLGGTIQYMSPEQLRATSDEDTGPCLLDARSDVYSLGVILYELLSGEHPFGPLSWHGSIEVQIHQALRLHRQGSIIPLRRANPQVGRDLAKVVEKCLAPDPSDRYQSAAEMARALRRGWLGRWLGRHRTTLAAAAAAAGIFAAIVAVVLALRPPYQEREMTAGTQAYRDGAYAEAIDHFGRALAEEQSARAYFARGRAYLKAGDPNKALDDLNAADQLEPSGQTKAALGYCCNLTVPPRHRDAEGNYQSAIRNYGVTSAAIYNNLGYSRMYQKGGSIEAAQYLDRAIQLDPRLQTACYNRVTAELIVLIRDRKLYSRGGPTALAALRKVFELGPASQTMHLNAAQLYVLAKELEPRRWKELALEHIATAIDLGLPPINLKTDLILSKILGKEASFQRLMSLPPVAIDTPIPTVARVLDPITDY